MTGDEKNELVFSKRVVHVWFQNMRARQRRKGRVGTSDLPPPYHVAMTTASLLKTENAMQNAAFAGKKASRHLAAVASSYNMAVTMQVETVDLSVKDQNDISGKTRNYRHVNVIHQCVHL